MSFAVPRYSASRSFIALIISRILFSRRVALYRLPHVRPVLRLARLTSTIPRLVRRFLVPRVSRASLGSWRTSADRWGERERERESLGRSFLVSGHRRALASRLHRSRAFTPRRTLAVGSPTRVVRREMAAAARWRRRHRRPAPLTSRRASSLPSRLGLASHPSRLVPSRHLTWETAVRPGDTSSPRLLLILPRRRVTTLVRHPGGWSRLTPFVPLAESSRLSGRRRRRRPPGFAFPPGRIGSRFDCRK